MDILFLRLGAECLREFDDLLIVLDGQDTAIFAAATFICSRARRAAIMLSHAFAKEEVERFTYRSPGQANSYFYGYTRLLALRREVEAALGPKFDQQKFHDFIPAQGLLTPDLMRRAVLETFVPSHARQQTTTRLKMGARRSVRRRRLDYPQDKWAELAEAFVGR
jgi:uncharacterized protein (DUF885 family)